MKLTGPGSQELLQKNRIIYLSTELHPTTVHARKRAKLDSCGGSFATTLSDLRTIIDVCQSKDNRFVAM